MLYGEETMKKRELLFCDVETTGLSADDEVLELALVTGDEKIIFNRRFGTVARRIWTQAENIHGISPEDVNNLQPLNCFEDQLRELTRDHDVIFYNAAYDTKYLGKCLDPSCRIFCAMLTHDRMFQRRKLMQTLDDHGIPRNDLTAHSAADDCTATARLWKFMRTQPHFKPVRFFPQSYNHICRRDNNEQNSTLIIVATVIIAAVLFIISTLILASLFTP